MDRESDSGRQLKRGLLLLFAAALVVRFVAAVFVFPSVAGGTGLNTSSDGWEHLARNLVAGNGHRFTPDGADTTVRMPLYPILLAVIFRLFGETMWIVQLVQAAIGAGTTVLTCLIARRCFGSRAGWLAGIAYAVYPGDIVACARYLAEPLAILLMMTGIYFLGRLQGARAEGRRGFRIQGLGSGEESSAVPQRSTPCQQKPVNGGLRWSVAAGVAFGLMTITRSSFAYLPLVLIALWLLRPSAWRMAKGTILHILCMLVPLIAVQAPWVLRVHRLTGHWVYPSTLSGHGLIDGYAVAEHLSSGKTVGEMIEQGRLLRMEIMREQGITLHPRDRDGWFFMTPIDEYKADRAMKTYFLDAVRDEPLRFVWRVVRHVPRFWYLGRTHGLTVMSFALNVPLVCMAIIGFVRAGRRCPEAWLWAATIVYFNVVSAATLTQVRYSLAAIPLVMILAAALVGRLRGAKAA